MDDNIKEGDTVRLKSGGPVMTLDRVSAKVAECIWFKGSSSSNWEYQAGTFLVTSLEPAREE